MTAMLRDRRRARRDYARAVELGARIVSDYVPGLPGYRAVRRAWPIRLWRRLRGRPLTNAGDVLRAFDPLSVEARGDR